MQTSDQANPEGSAASLPTGRLILADHEQEPYGQTRPDAGRVVSEADDEDGCVGLYSADRIGPHARFLGTYTTTQRSGLDASRFEGAVATGVAPDRTLVLTRPSPDPRCPGPRS